MASTQSLQMSPALTDQRRLRLFVVLILYIAQGLPIGFFYYALPAWQAQNGATAAAVGSVLALVSLPWSLKLINGVVMDRFAYLPMGRRRPWLIAGQGGIVLGLFALGIADPGPLDAALLGAFAFAINLATTIQDVAVDGLAIDVIPETELGRANGFMFGGQSLGIAAGAALSGHLLASGGLSLAMPVLAAGVGAALLLLLAVRERPGERLLPWSRGEASTTSRDRQLGSFGAILLSLRTAMARRNTLLFAAALFCGGASYGLFIGFAPLYGANVVGWTEDTYANWAGRANLAAGLLGVLMFGFLAERMGPRRLNTAQHLLVALGSSIFYLLLPGSGGEALLIVAIMVFIALDVCGSISGSAVAMRLCVPAVAATQFSLFMAAANLGISAASASLGTLDRFGGLEAMVLAMVATGLCGATLATVARVGR